MLEITYIVLTLIAFMHFYWALGYKWGLDKAFPTGIKGQSFSSESIPELVGMLKVFTILIGVILLWFAYVAYMLSEGHHSRFITYMGWSIGILFVLRAIGDFNIVGIFKQIKGTLFSKYDAYVYIPLCLFIGYAFISYLSCL